MWHTIPLRISGQWGTGRPTNVQTLLESARDAYVSQIKIDARFAPTSIDVVGEPSQPFPMVKALPGPHALMRLTAHDQHWAQTAYQFGHEFGHVLCNSWGPAAIPAGPSHWLEEALVEAFSISGLQRLARCWGQKPPYSNWAGYEAAISQYAANALNQYAGCAGSTLFKSDGRTWLQQNQPALAASLSLTAAAAEAVPYFVDAFTRNPHLVRSMAALNTWPTRGALPLPDYLQAWIDSCQLMNCPRILPEQLVKHFA